MSKRDTVMNLLSMNGVSKVYTEKVLLKDAVFGIGSDDRIGVIGINGTGKSTLLKIIAGIEEADSGEIIKGKNIVITYLPQMPVFDRDYTLYEYVVAENVKRSRPQDDYEAKNLEAEIEGEAKKILGRLGFADIDQKISTFSGGQKKKAALAACLLAKSDILLLDEPTNHLDNAMTEWLQDYLEGYRGALVMVTHDRYFLDLVCNRIVEVDKGNLYTYDKNYEGFLEKKAERIASALSTQDKHANILRKEIAWMRRGARARTTKQKAHIQRYEALRDEKKIELDADVEIKAVSSRLGKKTIELNGISKSYGEKILIKDFTYNFLRDDRVGILGPNGCGKSTLMKIIMQSVKPDTGTVEIGDTVVPGYYAQEAEAMDDNERVIDYVRSTAEYIKTDDGYISASQMCEKFLFSGAMQYQPIGKLSGGEKRRLYLCKVLMKAPNVLILDEPTNDLDISTLQILEDYLDSFPGIVIAVSHDRYFLDRTSRRMLTFDSKGGIHLFNGTYTDFFREYIEGIDGSIRKEGEEIRSSSDPGKKSVSSKERRNGPKPLKFTFKEEREYETIERDISECESKIAELEQQMVVNATDFVKLAELSEQKVFCEQELERLMERYFYLEEKAEKIKRGECVDTY